MVPLYQKILGIGWDKNRPSPDELNSYQWRNGNKVIESNSIGALINPDWISSDTFNISWPGDIPKNVIEQFPLLEARHKINPIIKAYLGIGGNLWTAHSLNPIDYNMKEYLDSMHEMICLYKTILPARDIVVASLPYIDPSVKIFDMAGPKSLPRSIKKHIKNIQVDELFAEMSIRLIPICNLEGVKLLNIHSILKQLWREKGRSYWYDRVHPSQKALKFIASEIKRVWGI